MLFTVNSNINDFFFSKNDVKKRKWVGEELMKLRRKAKYGGKVGKKKGKRGKLRE